ncbi:MAG: DSD1 family PLP-dependent enzyme [Candidatus Aminicenantes bacterium]|nr:DSD1 family PLP-dependent enzyme [Candidatus Aminicenantes bacterium]
MSQTHDPLIGRPVSHVPTPALIVDIGALEHNLRLLSGFFAGRHAKLRPHFKSHKCVAIAKRQLEAGNAVGVTCAKLSEAEVLAAGGVPDILIANQIVGRDKLERVAGLARRCRLAVAVDDEAQVRQLSAALAGSGATVGVLVEVDVGLSRCGVPPGERALQIARVAAAASGVEFLGIQAYEGHCITVLDPEDRRRQVLASMQKAVDTRRLIEASGLPVRVLSGGGTGSYDMTGLMDGVDEVQAGSYALMDGYYVKRRPEFATALSVITTVISSNGSDHAVLDVGVKGVGADLGPPAVLDRPGDAISRFESEEHASVRVGGPPLEIGDKVRLLPSHGCTTCNLHRRLIAVRNGTVEDVWAIDGSGCLD